MTAARNRRRSDPQASPGRRFVLASDLHLHPWAAFSKGEGGSNTRLLQTLAVLSASLNRAKELGVPWVFAGDIVHTAGYTLNVVMSKLVEVLSLYNDVTKLAVWGNHDARGVGGRISLGQTVLGTIQRAVENFVVLDPTCCKAPFRVGDLTFSGSGYQPRPEFLELAEESDVGIYHQTIRGTKTATGFELEEGILGADLLERHKFVAVGHVHHWQYHSSAQNCPGQQLLIPGSPEQHNFGDAGQHGWWIIDVPPGQDGKPQCEMVLSGSPEFITVETPDQIRDSVNYYRVRNAVGKALPTGAQAIAPAPNVVEQRNVLQGARGEQVLEAWMSADPPDEALDKARVLAIGRELVSVREEVCLRPYQLTRLWLKNFCSYEDAKLDVTPGTWLVVGRGKDFPSNGAGKSTLFEAIFWAIFGSTTKGLTGDEVIRWGASECEVLADFEAEGDAWLQVVRRRGKQSTLKVTYGTGEFTEYSIEGKSVNEVTEKLQKHLGITADLYKALGYFSQEDLVLFASATDGRRKDMLADLIGLGAYQDASSAAGRKADEAISVEQRILALRDAAQQRVDSERRRYADVQGKSLAWRDDKERRWAQATVALDTFDCDAEKIRPQLEAEARATLGRRLEERERQVAQQLKQAEVEAALPVGQTNTQKEVIDANTDYARASEALRTVTAQIAEVKNQVAAQERRINQYHATLTAGTCPTCQQPVTSEHRDKCLAPEFAVLEQIKERQAALEAQQRGLVNDAANAKLRAQEVNAGFEAGKLAKERQSNLMKAQAANLEVQQERDALEFDVGVHVQGVLEQRRNELASAITSIEREQDPFGNELAGIQERINDAEYDVTQHNAQRAALLADVAVYDYWHRGFSKQGIQSLLLDEIAGLFNECRGAIFPALTQGVYDVQFSTLSRTKGGEARERTEFQVFERGEAVPYSALSGGQRRRIDVGVMLTLVKAVSKWMQVPGALGLLVLDEVFGFLDNSGAEGLMEALREMQEQIPAIFVVSHDAQLQALFPEVITVVQDSNGISRVVGAEVS